MISPSLGLVSFAALAFFGGTGFGAKDLAKPALFKRLESPGIPVVDDGRAMPVVSADSPRSIAAAVQLADVIRRATGVKPDIIREFRGAAATNRPALFVGETAASAAAGLVAPAESPEAFRVVAHDGSIFFLGREDFAVFDWCERELGARCFWLDPDGEELSVPEVPEVNASPVDYSDWPAYGMRVCGSCAGQRWARFSKVGNAHRGGVRVHAPHAWHKDRSLVAGSPGIFALAADGSRATTPLLCYGNPETLLCYERRIDEAIAGVRDSGGIVDTRRKVITVSPWDIAYNCCCGFCRESYDESLGQYGNASPIVWGRFLKGLAKWAKREHPDYMISFLPYWNMCEVPPGLDLTEEGNCEAEICIMPGLALLKDEPVRLREEGLVRRWTEVTGRKAILWHYSCWPAEFTSAPYLFGETVRNHWRNMRGIVDGCFVCGGGEVPRLSLMHYVWMRSMWNPDLDVEAVYDVFAERMFGPAAKPMRRLMRLQESGWSRRWTDEGVLDGNVYGISYPPWTVREMKRLLVSADRLAANDAEALRRVRRYASMFADFFDDAEKVHYGERGGGLVLSRTDVMPTIDGVLDEECWSGASPLCFVRAMDRSRSVPRYGTEIRGIWRDDGFVLGFRLDEPAVDLMPSHESVYDFTRHDYVDVFLTDASTRTGCVHIVRFDADGRLVMSEGNFLRPAGEARVAVSKTGGSWSAELFIPFSAIGGRPAALSGNATRWRAGDGTNGEWTRLSTRFANRSSDRNAFIPFVFGILSVQ